MNNSVLCTKFPSPYNILENNFILLSTLELSIQILTCGSSSTCLIVSSITGSLNLVADNRRIFPYLVI